MRFTRSGRQATGFTLLELMIVVAIVAILATIAYSSYSSSTTKTRRADAQAALLGFAQAMERYKTENGTYVGAGSEGVGNITGAPTIFSDKAPIDGSQTFYDLTINAADGTSYTLYATPVGAQAGDGRLGLRSTGQRGWDRDGDMNPFGAGETCWETSC